MLTVALLCGLILFGFLIVVIAEKLDSYINRDASLRDSTLNKNDYEIP